MKGLRRALGVNVRVRIRNWDMRNMCKQKQYVRMCSILVWANEENG